MEDNSFLDYVEEVFSLDDILYIIGKDKRWLLEQIYEDLIDHREDFFQGDVSYSEVYDAG